MAAETPLFRRGDGSHAPQPGMRRGAREEGGDDEGTRRAGSGAGSGGSSPGGPGPAGAGPGGVNPGGSSPGGSSPGGSSSASARPGGANPGGSSPGGPSSGSAGARGSSPGGVPPAGRGWGTVAILALVTVGLSIVHPALLIFLPLSLLLLALPPRRPAVAVLAIVLAGVAFLGPVGGRLWYIERGWVLLLGAWFVIMVVAWPAGRFLMRALAALGATLGSVALLLLVNRGAWGQLDWTIARHLRDGARDAVALWGAVPGLEEWTQELTRAVYQAVELQAQLYPALLALASLAALAIAWWGYRRLAMREARPLEPLREFRFHDELIWMLIAGLVLVVLPLTTLPLNDPLGDAAMRTGSNVLAFMAALYALRGAAVILVLFGMPGIVGTVLAALAVLLLYPLVMAATVVVGVSDTWLDLRRRRRPARGGP